MIDVAMAISNCTCEACKAFDAWVLDSSGFMDHAIVHSASDFAAPPPGGAVVVERDGAEVSTLPSVPSRSGRTEGT